MSIILGVGDERERERRVEGESEKRRERGLGNSSVIVYDVSNKLRPSSHL